MGHSLSRQELYDKVWSKPVKKLAPEYGVSDVALSKACRKANIPLPPRGYWAKIDAGKQVQKIDLPPRFPGASDEVRIGYKDQYYQGHRSDQEILSEPLPPPPSFLEDIESLNKRVSDMVSKVSCPQLSYKTHPMIEKLLKNDAELVASSYSWEKGIFSSKSDKRRLRLLNAIFLAVGKLGCKSSMTTSKYDPADRDAYIQVGEQGIGIKIEEIHTRSPRKQGKLRLSIINHYRENDDLSWEDSDDSKLERHLTEIVNTIITHGEFRYRRTQQYHHEWLIERKAELKERLRLQMEEEERKARELKEKREKERIERLLFEAQSLQDAETIRSYVSTVLSMAGEIDKSSGAIEKWSSWALSQADRIDPIKSKSYIEDIQEL